MQLNLATLNVDPESIPITKTGPVAHLSKELKQFVLQNQRKIPFRKFSNKSISFMDERELRMSMYLLEILPNILKMLKPKQQVLCIKYPNTLYGSHPKSRHKTLKKTQYNNKQFDFGDSQIGATEGFLKGESLNDVITRALKEEFASDIKKLAKFNKKVIKKGNKTYYIVNVSVNKLIPLTKQYTPNPNKENYQEDKSRKLILLVTGTKTDQVNFLNKVNWNYRKPSDDIIDGIISLSKNRLMYCVKNAKTLNENNTRWFSPYTKTLCTWGGKMQSYKNIPPHINIKVKENIPPHIRRKDYITKSYTKSYTTKSYSAKN